MKTTRRTGSTFERAEAAFKAATTKPVEPAAVPRATTVPEGKEMVSIRLDNAVLAHFQEDGPGWQDRINAALRKAAGLEGK